MKQPFLSFAFHSLVECHMRYKKKIPTIYSVLYWALKKHIFLFTHRASHVALVVKNMPVSTGDTRDTVLIPGSGRSPGVGSGNLLQYSFISLSNLKFFEHQLGVRKCMGMCH